MEEQLEPSELEKATLGQFCSKYVELTHRIDILTQKKKESSLEKKDLHDKLYNYMIENQQTCIPVNVDSKDLYLRIIKTNSKRQIGEKTITDMIGHLNVDLMIVVAHTLQKQNSTTPSMYEVLCESICITMDQTCSYVREYVDLTPSKERKVSAEPKPKKRKGEPKSPEVVAPIHVLPKEIKKCALDFYKVDQTHEEISLEISVLRKKLEAISKNLSAQKRAELELKEKEKKAETEEKDVLVVTQVHPTPQSPTPSESSYHSTPPATPDQADVTPEDASRQVISQYLTRFYPEKMSSKIVLTDSETNQSKDFYLREKEYKKLKAFRVAEFKPTVKGVVRNIFTTSKVPLEIQFSEDQVGDLLDPNLLKTVMSQLISTVVDRRKEISVPLKGISLDAVPNRKRKHDTLNKTALEKNRLDEDDEEC